ncbi:probable G-protein coupled receptor Mth-like 3 isoform X1 [Drosophila albomicans]|nr:probable G-protein coupled receptor Mth-like 3 isoform X1 [Drosophila albomicans]
MSVALALMYLIFSCVSANINSIGICCSPESKLDSELLKCIPATNIQNATDNYDVQLDQIDSPLGYDLARHNETITDCATTRLSNVSLASETSVEISAKSCLLTLNNRLIILTCKPEANDVTTTVPTSRIGFVNKCCPHSYIYSSEFNRCVPGTPDFDVYSSIVDRPMIFVDNPLLCANNKVLVEYTVTAEVVRVAEESKLVWQDGSRQLKRSQFCIEAIDGKKTPRNIRSIKRNQQFLIRTCQQSKICDSLPCVRRCCADGEIYYKKNMTTLCKRDPNDILFESFASLKISGNFTKPAVFGLLHGMECPKFRLDPDSFSDEEHTISSTNGSLFITSTSKKYANSQYCIEKIKNSSMADDKLYTFVCFDSKVVGNDRIRFKMYPIGLLISCCFYAMTLAVYISIEKLRNLPGKILICLVSSLLLAYLGIALGQLMPTSNNKVCVISGFLVYFFLMSAFSWMNITCFDIWKTFGSTKSKNVQRREQRNRFIWYSVYGWGLAIVLTIITATLSTSDVLSENIRPNFGNGRCWFTYDTIGYASLIFFSGPLGILLIINLVLFLLTLKYCNRVKREIFRMQSSNAEKPALRNRFFVDKTRFIMNTKLCFVMGITWLLEIASILLYDHKKNFFWSISDSFNVLLGVFVFFIFVFKRRVWNEIMMKLGFKTRSDPRRTGNTTCLTQSTYSAPSVSMRKMDIDEGEKSLTRI